MNKIVGNVTQVPDLIWIPDLIWNSHNFPLLLLPFSWLNKSLRKDFLCELNLFDFKIAG